MRFYILFLTCLLLLFSSCNGFPQKKEKTETSTIHRNEKGKPEVTIKVNKHFDKKGNLVSFDSTYRFYYSSSIVNKKMMDSLVQEFKKPFSEQFPLANDEYFKTLFFTDSLVNRDFFHEDFFRKRIELNDEYMRKMVEQMDEFKNEFFKIQSIQHVKKSK
jgi:hypothetical protein